jgi:hypothetical protein
MRGAVNDATALYLREAAFAAAFAARHRTGSVCPRNLSVTKCYKITLATFKKIVFS